jgi:chromosome segregation ATPase
MTKSGELTTTSDRDEFLRITTEIEGLELDIERADEKISNAQSQIENLNDERRVIDDELDDLTRQNQAIENEQWNAAYEQSIEDYAKFK